MCGDQSPACSSTPYPLKPDFISSSTSTSSTTTGASAIMFPVDSHSLFFCSLRLETGVFDGRPADYFFMLLFNWMLAIIVALFMSIPFIMDPMVMSILYVWCQLNKDTIVNFWFGTQFKAMYLPWVLFGFNMIIAGGGVMELVGILIGHMYFFLMFKYPQVR